VIAVSLLAVLPQDQSVITTGWDKANHTLAFFVLLGLLDNAYPSMNLWIKKIAPLIAYAILIELVQSQIPGRYASLLDIIGDAVGLGLYLLIRSWLINYLPFINADQFR
jgi:VanZ family protein